MRASGFRPCPTLRPYCRSKWRELDGFGFGASWAPTIPSHCVCACWFCIVIGFEPPVQSQLQILIMTQQRNGKGERFGVVGILSPLFLILPQVSGQSLSPVLMHYTNHRNEDACANLSTPDAKEAPDMQNVAGRECYLRPEPRKVSVHRQGSWWVVKESRGWSAEAMIASKRPRRRRRRQWDRVVAAASNTHFDAMFLSRVHCTYKGYHYYSNESDTIRSHNCYLR